MPATDDLAATLAAVRARIAAAALAAGRDPRAVALLAVSKAQSAARVRALAGKGQRAFGENYPQEALPKIEACADLGLDWHFIGQLQANKARGVAERFAWVHSLDRIKVAERLDAARPAGLPPLQVLLQVNVSAEPQKGGVVPAELLALARAVVALPRLALRGLMCIPAPQRDAALQRAPYRALRLLGEQLRAEIGAEAAACDQLSMGMSDDLEAAIAEGATLVRVGTALFGSRG
jgi:pyridoxal phosphate enzyme (YggS family)